MSKATVPHPPQPSYSPPAGSATFSSPRSSSASSAASNSLDLAFLGRVLRTTCWLGALFSLLAFVFTKSSFAAGSFAFGAALSVTLLWSQMFFVGRMAASFGSNKATSSQGKVVAALALPVKYAALLLLLGALFHFNLIAPVAFVMGVSMTQLVIVAKVAGRMLSSRSIAEVYVKKDKNAR